MFQSHDNVEYKKLRGYQPNAGGGNASVTNRLLVAAIWPGQRDQFLTG